MVSYRLKKIFSHSPISLLISQSSSQRKSPQIEDIWLTYWLKYNPFVLVKRATKHKMIHSQRCLFVVLLKRQRAARSGWLNFRHLGHIITVAPAPVIAVIRPVLILTRSVPKSCCWAVIRKQNRIKMMGNDTVQHPCWLVPIVIHGMLEGSLA